MVAFGTYITLPNIELDLSKSVIKVSKKMEYNPIYFDVNIK